MTKKELIDFAIQESIGLEDVDSLDFKFSLEAAIYYYCNNYHEGQFSDKYEILCNSDYHPGRIETFESWSENDFTGFNIYSLFEFANEKQ